MGEIFDYYREGSIGFDRKMHDPRPKRFFLAHSKAASDNELERQVSVVSALLDRFAKGKPFDLILGRTYFEARFKECGSWDAWCEEVAQGIDPVTRTPLFNGIFVPAGPVGAGTAKIIKLALNPPQRKVVCFDEEGKTAKVVGIRLAAAGDWQTGYRLMVDRDLT